MAKSRTVDFSLPDGYTQIENFDTEGDGFSGVFEATGEFTLYLRKERPGEVNIYVIPDMHNRPAAVHLPPNFLYNEVVMADFGGLVFPKVIFVKSEVPVKLAAYKCNS